MSSNNNHARRRSFSTSAQLGALCALALPWLAPAFAAGTLEYCTAPGLAIPDDSPAGVDSTLNVPYDDELLAVYAYVRGEHTWVADLRVELTHPSGSPTVVMINEPESEPGLWCSEDDFDVWLDDSAAASVQFQCFSPPPALRDRATPLEPLSAFNGLNTQGDWVLNIADNQNSDTGTLQEWCLELVMPTHSIGGPVTGLSGSGLVLRNNGADDLAVAANGNFSFETTTPNNGATYDVTVHTEPTAPSQSCTVSNGTGTVEGDNVTDIEVNCVTDQFTVGGTVSGLAGDQLVLQNNGGDDQVLTADGSFTFAALDDGSAYDITVLTQPDDPSQTCSVINGSDTLAGADVTDVLVDCVDDPPEVVLSAGALDYGIVLNGNMAADSLTVTNTGVGELVISELIEPEAPFAVTGGTCNPLPVTLPSGESCDIEIAFTPMAASGDFVDELAIVSNAPSSPDVVTLSGSLPPLPVPALDRYGMLLLMLLMTGLVWRVGRPSAG